MVRNSIITEMLFGYALGQPGVTCNSWITSRSKSAIGATRRANVARSNQPRLNTRATVEAIRNAPRLLDHMSPYDIIEKYADGKPFAPLNPQEKTVLASRYKKDLESIKLSI